MRLSVLNQSGTTEPTDHLTVQQLPEFRPWDVTVLSLGLHTAIICSLRDIPLFPFAAMADWRLWFNCCMPVPMHSPPSPKISLFKSLSFVVLGWLLYPYFDFCVDVFLHCVLSRFLS